MLHLSTPIAAGLTLLATLIAGAILESCVYYPFAKKKSTSGVVMLASLGVMIIIENTIALLFGNNVKSISVDLEPTYIFYGLKVTRIQLYEFLICASAFVILGLLIRKNPYFKVAWAMGDQPRLVPVMGLPLQKIRQLIIAVSSLMIALPAALIAYDVGIEPHVGMSYLLTASVAVFFGGIDKYWGWGLGAFILALCQSIVSWKFSGEWVSMVTFIILIFVLLFKPSGLIGNSKRLEEK